MIFAADESEFNALLTEMQNLVLELGYEDVLAFDLEVAKALNEA